MDNIGGAPTSCGGGKRPLWPLILLVVAFASSALLAQYQKKPPDFGGIYSFPTPTHPEPRGIVLLSLDVAMLAVGLGLGHEHDEESILTLSAMECPDCGHIFPAREVKIAPTAATVEICKNRFTEAF